MRIGINLIDYDPSANTELKLYIESLFRYLAEISPKDISYYFYGYNNNIELIEKEFSKLQFIFTKLEKVLTERQSLILNEVIEKDKLDLWFCPYPTLKPYNLISIPSIILIQSSPNNSHKLESQELAKLRNFNYQSSVVVVDRIFTFSESAKQTIIKETGISEQKIICINVTETSEESAKQTLDNFLEVIKNAHERKKLAQQKISIVTTTFNQGDFIERTIQSVLTQDYKNIEYVITDGASTDQTISIIKKYEDKLKWVSEKDRGQTDGINKGLRMVTGDIVAYLNSDDTYYPDTLSFIAEIFNKNPEIDIVYGLGKHIDENDNFLKDYESDIASIENLRRMCPICQPALFMRKSLYQKIGEFDENFDYGMDYEYWLRVSKNNYKIFFVNKYLATSRLHTNAKTLSSAAKIYSNVFDIQKKYFGNVHYEWIVGKAMLGNDFNLFKNRSIFFKYYKFIRLFIKAFVINIKTNKRLPALDSLAYSIRKLGEIFE